MSRLISMVSLVLVICLVLFDTEIFGQNLLKGSKAESPSGKISEVKTSLTWKKNPKKVFPNAVFTNESQESIFYYGYSKQSPLFGFEVKTKTGWENSFMGWCGTGAQAIELKPGESVEFNSLFLRQSEKPVECRLVISYKLENDKHFDHKVVSGSLTTRDHKVWTWTKP